MNGRQVEVVMGTHVLARVADAVILVAHREPARLHDNSTAVVALESLAELVAEVAGRAPHGPGQQIAREATRWLMKEATRISSQRPIEFGIVSAAESGGVSIFLHGGISAVFAGDTTERVRGGDAMFTVDRVEPVPDRAVALFVDDAKGRIPDLPQDRGVGWLVEGVAQACGAVVWTQGARRPIGPAAQPVRGAHRQAEVPPTARVQHEAEPATPSSPGESAAAEANDDRTEVGGTNPAPQPDPDLQRRLEATAKASTIAVKVRGFKCARAHPSDPRAAFCTVCGMPVDQTQPLLEVVRPPLGNLVLDDGTTFMVAADAVLGRDPESSDAVQQGLIPMRVEDSSGGTSRAHAEIRLLNWDVAVVDRGSTNGTRTRMPGYRDWVRLAPNQSMILVAGAEIMLGNRVLRFEHTAPPPFG